MFHRHAVHHRRTDFLSALVVVVGLAFLLTVALQAQAGYRDDRCHIAAANGQRHAPVLDSAPSIEGGYLRCQTSSTSASWASAIWGAFTR
jgi:hypothetical protein